MVKLKDIAKKTGVTVSTVSAALNGRGNMKEETRLFLLETAKEMGYEPNQAARQLRNKPAVDVGLIINDKYTNLRRGGTYLAHISEFLSLCAKGGLSNRIEFFTDGENKNAIPELIRNNVARGFIHVGYITEGIGAFLKENPGYPLVSFQEPGEFSVRANTGCGAYLAMQYLAACGHRHIMTSFGPLKYDTHFQIHRSAMQAFDEFHLTRLGEEFQFEPQGDDSGKDHMKTLLDWCFRALSLTPRPTAYYCSGSFTGRAMIAAANKLGLRVPEDVSIITNGIVNEGSGSYPALTSVELNYPEMFSAAFFILGQLAAGKTPIRSQVIVDTELIIQESVANLNQQSTYNKKEVKK